MNKQSKPSQATSSSDHGTSPVSRPADLYHVKSIIPRFRGENHVQARWFRLAWGSQSQRREELFTKPEALQAAKYLRVLGNRHVRVINQSKRKTDTFHRSPGPDSHLQMVRLDEQFIYPLLFPIWGLVRLTFQIPPVAGIRLESLAIPFSGSVRCHITGDLFNVQDGFIWHVAGAPHRTVRYEVAAHWGYRSPWSLPTFFLRC